MLSGHGICKLPTEEWGGVGEVFSKSRKGQRPEANTSCYRGSINIGEYHFVDYLRLNRRSRGKGPAATEHGTKGKVQIHVTIDASRQS